VFERDARTSNADSREADVATELPGQVRSQTEFGNEEKLKGLMAT